MQMHETCLSSTRVLLLFVGPVWGPARADLARRLDRHCLCIRSQQ
jgi:hypothetical protein